MQFSRNHDGSSLKYGSLISVRVGSQGCWYPDHSFPRAVTGQLPSVITQLTSLPSVSTSALNDLFRGHGTDGY